MTAARVILQLSETAESRLRPSDRAALAGLLALHRSAVEAELERLALDRQRGMRDGFLQSA